MAMMEAAKKIDHLRREVMWRKRWLALQDRLSATVAMGGLVCGALILYSRLRPGQLPIAAIIVAVSAAMIAFLLIHWLRALATERDAAFLIDDKLGLEDRLTTAQAILERGGPARPVEQALIEDAGVRIGDRRASSIVQYRLPRWYGLSLIGVAALSAALLIPERSLPGGEAMAQAREDINSAGERLEQTAEEVQQQLSAESETARLAKEQAELGRAFRRSTDTRAEALNKLSSLEGRIRERHDALAGTRADEIVNMAERRLRSALAMAAKRPPEPISSEGEKKDLVASGAQAGEKQGNASTAIRNERKPEPGEQARKSNTVNARAGDAKSNSNAVAQNKPDQELVGRNANTPARDASARQARAGNSNQAESQEQAKNRNTSQDPQQSLAQNANSPASQKSAAENAGQKEATQPAEQAEKQKAQGGQDSPTALPDLMAGQAAKALPNLSDQLLNKAEQLRAGQLTPADIKQLQSAAEFLARDLASIAQSKEFQKTVEQLARQINPEQIERVARELMNQENLRRELEATARMLMENRQIKDMVAGIARQFENNKSAMPERASSAAKERAQGESQSGQQARDRKNYPAGGRGSARGQQDEGAEGERLTGRGKQSRQGGNLKPRPGGEYLFLESKPGAGAVRAPYTSAYPQYRREAERSIQRSQVPAHMRSVVRGYFDAINPDAKKQP